MTATASTRTYAIDLAHSSVHFSVRHLMISKVRGTFDKLSGTIELPADSNIPRSITVTVDATSVNTREPQRDGHLRSADFLDVEHYPSLTFVSTSVTPKGSDAFVVTGQLEIHGTKREVTLNASLSGAGKDPWGNDRVGYEGTTKINRKDFGLTWNQALEAGGVAIGEDIDITIDVAAIPAPPATAA
jgi:polyisoprenoid-binding protein YceI